ncbi:DUF5681 domain-containing protein [Pararhizobium mangrovi]|uniref:DUF5681 domain-containing protein n=1 Tax=Pararhizobium mangrovi TaxID=2590452 RepID=A0A506TUW4_9HYPH|nr:DUF5681 domain-containing protein [Pararhizobium mangrovi]TPW25852.1 hypothetical protein FJU11_17490 [Pararhizobium mangrovi]
MKKGHKPTQKQREHLKRIGFQKGRSGNPKGRPPMPEEVKTKLAYLSDDAVTTLMEVMREGKNEASRVKAAEAVLAYQIAKAATKHEVDVTHGFDFRAVLEAAEQAEHGKLGTTIEADVIENTSGKHRGKR